MYGRRFYWILILLALCLPARAQQNVVGSGVYGDVKVTTSSYTGPGDVVAGASPWWGVRAYSAAVAATGTQKAVNLRNVLSAETCDVLIATSGDLASTVTNCSGASGGLALTVFCSTTCAVTKAYDQTGAHDASQSTGANQPTFTLSCVNSKPCMVGNGTSSQLATAAFTFSGGAVPYSFSIVAIFNAGANARFIGAFAACGVLYHPAANTWQLYAGLGYNAPSATDSVWHSADVVFNSASSSANLDGSANTGDSGATATCNTGLALFDDPSPSSPLGGDITEAGGWGALAFTTGQATSLCKNKQAYYGAGNFGAAC